MTIIASSLTSPNTGYNNQKKQVVDSNGNLYIVYQAQASSYSQIFVSKSTNGGDTWTDMSFPQIASYNQSYPSIAIDKNNNPHVIWVGIDSSNTSSQIKYSKFNGTSWSAWTNIQVISGYHQQFPSIDMDSNDKLHVVWQGRDSVNTAHTQIKYSNNISGTWSTWTNIQLISGYNQTYPSIKVDKQNNLNVVWQGLDVANANAQIKYSKFNGTSWSAWTNIQLISGYTQTFPTMQIDNFNNLHVVWQGTDSVNTTYPQIKYSKFNGTSWSAWTNIQVISDYAQQTPSIDISSNDQLHVVWQGCDSSSTTNLQIKYSKFDGFSWSAWENKTTDSVHSSPSLLYYNKKLYCAFQGNTTIEMFSLVLNKTKYLLQKPNKNNILFTINEDELVDLGTSSLTEELYLEQGFDNIALVNNIILDNPSDYKLLMYTDDESITGAKLNYVCEPYRPIEKLSNPFGVLMYKG